MQSVTLKIKSSLLAYLVELAELKNQEERNLRQRIERGVKYIKLCLGGREGAIN